MTIEYPYGTTERILTIIPNVTLQAGFMGFKSRQHSLVITNNRILFARITGARMKELSEQGKQEAKSEGRGAWPSCWPIHTSTRSWWSSTSSWGRRGAG